MCFKDEKKKGSNPKDEKVALKKTNFGRTGWVGER